MRLFAALLLLSGCDRVFGLGDVSGGAGDAAIDVGLVGERPWFCQSAQVFDEMTGTTPCEGWGAPFPGSMLAQHDGVLDIILPGTSAAFYGCTAYGPYDRVSDHGVFMKVAPLTTSNAYTTLTVRNAFGTTPEAKVSITYDTALRLYLDDVPKAVYSGAPPPAWWRIRQPAGTAEFVAELSEDGDTWMRWVAQTAPIPSKIAVDIGAGITSASMADKATVEVFGICQ